MILVITGFHSQPFDRLVRAMDDIARTISEEVVIQKGSSKIETKYAKGFSYESEGVMTEYFKNARLVVCHAGVGTIIEARRYRKPVIVVPRRSEHSEHHDNHQLEIAEVSSKIGAVMKVDDVQQLAQAIETSRSMAPESKDSSKRRLIEHIRHILENIEARKLP